MSKAIFTATELLNEFRSQEINESAHEEWALYRKYVTDFILENCDNGSSLAIYGAGRCDDIEIAELKKHFSEIVLVDVATDGILSNGTESNGIESNGIESNGTENDNSGRVIRARFDLLGMEEESYCKVIDFILDRFENDRLEQCTNSFADSLIELIRGIYSEDCHPKGIVPLLGKQYDYSVSIGLHSQLNNVFSGLAGFALGKLGVMPDNRQLITGRIEDFQRKYTAQAVQTANDIILDATLKGIILGFEYEVHRGEDVFTDVDGAVQCAADFEQLQRDGIVRCIGAKHLEWNIDAARGLTYDMCLAAFTL